ncbi:MAG: hypothetical protein WKF40_03105 [Thermoleophilaceae bacterium]
MTLGLAAGSLGLGPGAHAHAPLLDPGYVGDRGGALGELLYAGSSALFSDLGAHIIFLFLVIGGALLVTGASIAGVVATARDSVNATTEQVRRSTGQLTAVLSREPAAPAGAAREPVGDGPPSPPAWSRWCTQPTWRPRRWTPRPASPTSSAMRPRRRGAPRRPKQSLGWTRSPTPIRRWSSPRPQRSPAPWRTRPG